MENRQQMIDIEERLVERETGLASGEDAGRGGSQERQRWQMSRAGIFNFWFYEDEVFELEEGRLVLRGTNGAGKSVTMQSFVPLVLDGDKRPHRLDPFGSKDRRIEYYLLGDRDEHNDRIGYLWLEFVHPAKGICKTIGIGLRARRGMAQVNFWGFVLEDGRRIGHDFWLYDRMLQQEGGGEHPLDRKALEQAIGSGGQVVQEQRAYRELVNRSLFGFHDKEAYIDLLQLLVQLRSPKLSKDVKPTVIYDILTQALPPLHEEELRPLSEVMEDMDQLADRLEELKLHQAELGKLNRSYEQYNRYLLYQGGQLTIQAHAEREEARRQLANVERERQSALDEQAEIEQRQAEAREELVAAESEMELLNRSEAMEKQYELEQTERALKETERHADQAQHRLTAALRAREAAELGAEKARRRQAELLEAQQDTLADMEALAGDMEFEYHGVYARNWSPAPPGSMDFAAGWRKDADEHRRSIGEAIRLAEQERDAALLVAEFDKQLGARRAERDVAEERLRSAEQASDTALRDWKEAVLEWRQSLSLLKLDEAAGQEMFAAIGELGYERQELETAAKPVRAAAETIRQSLVLERLEGKRQVQQLQAELADVLEEKRAWEQSREPEPPRSEARARTRSRYSRGEGASLFEVCEFYSHIGDRQRAGIELALLNSGWLDAWISSDGRASIVGEHDEDIWIAAEPIEWGYTLADVLKAAPSESSGLSEAQVEAVLRTFALGDRFTPSLLDGSDGEAVLTVGNGYYQLGPLTGKADAEHYEAQYIGKEARRKFKLAEIERLKREAERIQAELELVRERMDAATNRMEQLERELSTFPIGHASGDALRAAWRAQYEAGARFELLFEEEQKLAGELMVKRQHWSGLKQELIAATSRWTRLKSLKDMAFALDALGKYSECLSLLQSDWREYRQADAEALRYEAEAVHQAELAELEEDNRDSLTDRKFELKVKAEQLRKLMDEMGLSNLYERLSVLKNRRSDLLAEQKRLADALLRVVGQVSAMTERKNVAGQREKEAGEKYASRLHAFRTEWDMQLVPEIAGQPLGLEEPEAFASCKEVVSRLEPLVSRSNRERLSGVLQDLYNASKHLLNEYSLEADISDQGRITLLSMRDRNRPQKPVALLAEVADMMIEQENLLSEKDRQLFEEIILRSVGQSIRQRIQRAELWMKTMNKLMAERNTSSGLRLQLQWLPKAAQSEAELNSDELVELLRRDPHLLRDEEVERLVGHFRSRVQWAKQGAAEEREALRKHIYDMLDYRTWFQFSLRYKKGEETHYREMTDARFNVLSGGEKAMSMYIPLFAATYSRYADASPDAPKIISLDEAFAGVDDENIRDLFGLLTEMDFDYMMTSQVLWGCYDTVPKLAISEIYRPKDANYVTVFRYKWNGKRLEAVAASSGGEDQGREEEA